MDIKEIHQALFFMLIKKENIRYRISYLIARQSGKKHLSEKNAHQFSVHLKGINYVVTFYLNLNFFILRKNYFQV